MEVSEVEDFKLIAREGDRVRYVPSHAHGDAGHSDCEDGTITSFGRTAVFVRFDKNVRDLGWGGATSKSCSIPDLRVL